MGLTLYRIPFSTNVERVALALAHKDVAVDWVDVDPADRSPVVEVSGQELVPVLVDGDLVLHDSPRILEHLEERFPEPPLFPRDPARREELRSFLDWFNQIWKRPPNLIAAEELKPDPDRARIAELEGRIAASLDRFEALLAGRDYLFGDELTAADVTAFPFLKYAVLWQDGRPGPLPRDPPRDDAARRPLPAARGVDPPHGRRSPAPELGKTPGRSAVLSADDGKEHSMHPALTHEIARYHQADLLREAERARLAHEASTEGRSTRRRWLRRRERTAFKPAFGR